MPALIISNQTTFGSLTNTAVSRLVGLNTSLERLGEAISTASSGYEGEPGTQFETSSATMGGPMSSNNFGVQADPNNPGQNGQAYNYAVSRLNDEWNKFWSVAKPFISQLDNGSAGF